MNELLYLFIKGLIWIILIALFLFMLRDVEQFLALIFILAIFFLIFAILAGIIILFIYLIRGY